MKLFSLWEWNNIFPKYRNMICVILNSMSWVTVSSTVVSLTIASAGQRSSMMSIAIYLLATSLTACLTVKLVVEYAKAPLEAKAYAPRAKVLRDGMWINVHAVNLVPGDIIFLKVGDIVPANARVLRFEKINTMTCWAKRDKIELFAKGVNEDQAIVLASRASRSQHELYIEPIDPAILSLLDDPEQARAGVQVIEHHAHFFVSLKLMFLATYIDENGSKCCVFKGDPANASHLYNIHTTEKRVAHQCGCSKAVKERISMIMDNLAVDGYQAIAVGHQVIGVDLGQRRIGTRLREELRSKAIKDAG
nr:ATPase 9, plasma membrane-type-like [Oryza sativa Japonica Group]